MSDTPDIRERMARLETRLDHVTTTLEDTNEKLGEALELLMKLKAAWWGLGVVAAIAGWIAAKVGPLAGVGK